MTNIFSVVFSAYSGLLFGHLCIPEQTDKRWDFSEPVPCRRVILVSDEEVDVDDDVDEEDDRDSDDEYNAELLRMRVK